MKKKEIKEDFCGLCVAGAAAAVGAGAVTGTSKGTYKKYKKIIFWSGIITLILSFLFLFLFRKKCSSCFIKKI